MTRRLMPIALVLAALLSVGAFVAAGAVRAQGTSATPSPEAGSHPAHIHNGTCATLGSIAWPLNDVAAPGAPTTMMGTPVSGTPEASMASASPEAGMGPVVAESVTQVKVNLADLEKAPFAINVHESLANISNYIACGDITGAITNNSLSVPLKELNNSGFMGTAMLQDNGNGMTTVTIQLSQTSATGAMTAGGGAASPSAASGGSSQNAPTIEMVDIAFQPNDFSIAANTDVTVTLKNTGASPHNFSITDHNNSGVKNLNISVDVQPGETKTVTINAPAGDYYFFCNVPGHEAAGMSGKMHVQ